MNFKTIDEFVENLITKTLYTHIKYGYRKDDFLFAWDEKYIYVNVFDYMFTMNMNLNCEISFFTSPELNTMYFDDLTNNWQEFTIVVKMIETIIEAYSIGVFENFNIEDKYVFYVVPDGTIHGGLKENILKDFI